MNQIIIDNLYKTFATYSLSNPMIICCEHCFTKEDEKILKSRPLRKLEATHLDGYLDAPVIRSGNINDFKYLLPRILELESLGTIFHGINADIFHLFGEANYKSWNNNEVKVIDDYIKAYWQDILQKKAASFYFEIIACSGYSNQKLLDMLADDRDNLSHFILHGAWDTSELKNHHILQNWLRSDELINKIEHAFYATDCLPNADELSRAADMIESIRATHNRWK